MSEDVAGRLRELARDHSEGRLTLEAYRRLRAPLLDSVSSTPVGAEELNDVTRPRALPLPARAAPATPASAPHSRPERAAPTGHEERLPNPQPVSRTGFAGTSESSRAVTSEPSGPASRGRSRLIWAIPVALIVIAGTAFGGWVVWNKWLAGEGSGHRSEVTADTRQAHQSQATQADPVHVLIQPLLDRDDWSDARVAAVNAGLLETGSVRIAAAASTEWFQAFVDAVRRRLQEQQALGATPLTPDKSPLAALAVTIGLDLSSPDSAMKITTADQPAAASRELALHVPGARAGGIQASARDGNHEAGSTAIDGVTHAARVASGSGVGSRRHVDVRSSVMPAPPAPTNGAWEVSHARDSQVRPASSGSTPAPIAHAATAQGVMACRAELSRARLPYCEDVLPDGEPVTRLAVVPAGTYRMGNPDASDERPAHSVSIQHPFAISVNEISQAEFRRYCVKTGKPLPAQPWAGDDLPVVNVSWHDAQAYIQWLSQVTGERYRLPTEAEWEYAARAGQSGLFPSGDSLSPTDAYFSEGARLTAPAPRTQKFNANPWRLFHMVGNVREWVQDSWAASYEGAPSDGSARQGEAASARVVRGGSYADGRARLRVTTREGLSPSTRDAVTGIRVVREIH